MPRMTTEELGPQHGGKPARVRVKATKELGTIAHIGTSRGVLVETSDSPNTQASYVYFADTGEIKMYATDRLEFLDS